MAHWYLIHGAASSRLTWTRQLKTLASVSRADLPAFPTVSPENLVDTLADWCLSQLHQPSVIVGHSMGGAIAQRMALKSPSLIEGLVLAGTGPYLPVNPTLIQSLKDAPEETLKLITRWSLSKNPDPDLLARSLDKVRDIDPDRAYREFLACTYFDVRKELAQLQMPTAIIGGAEDRMTPAALTSEFLNTWPDAPYYTIPKAGHMMMLEQANAFNDVLTELSIRFNW